MIKRALIWLQKEEGWKAMLALTYAVICLFDFVVVPAWIGITRELFETQIDLSNFIDLDPSVQIRIIDKLSYQHEPFTLKGGGLFHIAFGALLTGSALTRLRGK